MTFALREHSDPWASEIVDLESLHKEITDAIVEEVEAISTQAQASRLPSTKPARLLLGPPGVGKTHLFTRLRRLVQQRRQRVSLIYIRPSPSAPQTPRMLLGHIFDQLRQMVGERQQIDLLVGAILALAGGDKHKFPNLHLNQLESVSEQERVATLDSILELLLEQHPDLEASDTYLEALLSIPFRQGRERRAWVSWLEGRECDDAASKRFSLPPPLAEEQILPALRTLAVVAAPASPLLLVFDQLENLVDATSLEPRIKAYARLLMELVDTVPGLVLVQMAVDSDWASRIEPFIDGAQRSRLSADATSRRRTLLSGPDAQQRRQLVEKWRSLLPTPAPFPWPFSPVRMAELERAPGLTPRMLLQCFQEALAVGEEPEGGEPKAVVPGEDKAHVLSDILEGVWQGHLSAARQRLVEADEQEREVDVSLLLDGLIALGALDGALKIVRDHEEPEVVEQASARRIALVLSANGRSAAGQLGRMLDRKPGEAPMLVMRERWRPFPDSWKKAHEYRRTLEARGVMRFEHLERDEVVELLALRSMLMALRSHDVIDADGASLEEGVALGWLRARPASPLARLRAWLRDPLPQAPEAAAAIDAESTPLPPRAQGGKPPAAPAREQSPVERLMRTLRVASIERIARELTREGKGGRASIREAVAASGGRLRLLGASVVVAVDDEVSP